MVKNMAHEGVKVWGLIRSEDGSGCFFEGANKALCWMLVIILALSRWSCIA